MASRLGWGIVGPGTIVRGTIAPVMVSEPTCFIAAVTSRDQGRADAFAADFGAAAAYDDYEAMLADPSVEAVFVGTPNAIHPAQVIAAARAGKHVLCDKPLAIDVESARLAVEACAASRVSLGINFHNRFVPWVADVRNLVATGAIGDVDTVTVDVGGGRKTYDNWRIDPEMAGLGTTNNVGVHALDFVRFILGAEPASVVAMFDDGASATTNEALAFILVRFDNGALAHFDCNERITYPTNEIVIQGTTGRIIGTGFTRTRSGGELRLLTDEGESTTHYDPPDAHRASVRAFTSAVLRGEPPSPSGIDGLRSVELLAAIETSVRERRIVDVTYADLP